MTPKEKAKELYNKYLDATSLYPSGAKQCALIAVGEILKEYIILKLNTFNCPFDYQMNCDHYKYWEKVEEEIENL